MATTDVDALDAALQTRRTQPRGVQLSTALYRALLARERIQMVLSTPWGLPAPGFGIELPCLDNSIFVVCNPMLDDGREAFKLPPDPPAS